ncbi:MAG: DUF4388 domain-containing protein [Deltaproteobacteria bacterium]|nr:DUF4388 domain-containing protein [Deltaproteobacteria bacterium]
MSVKEVVLNFTEGENEGVEIKLTPPRVIRVGRSEESDVFLGEKKISRKHCILHLGEDALSITDLESTNGTFVNSKRINEQLLEDGDRLRIGSSIVEVHISFDENAQEAATAASIDESTGESIDDEPTGEGDKVSGARRTEDINLGFEESSESHSESSESISFEDQHKEELPEEDSDLVVEYQDPSYSDEEESKTFTASAPDADDEFEELEVDNTTGDVGSTFSKEAEPVHKPMTSDELDLEKIPEIEEISEDLENDIEFLSKESPKAANKASAKKKKGKALSGDLSAMGLPDLLQNLNQNQKTGSLTLSFDEQEGMIAILEGKLYSAQVGKAVGSKAVYRMLAWDEGDFEFQPLDADAPEFSAKGVTPIQESVDGLLMEGMRQLDELNKIKDVLPKMSSRLTLNPSSDVPLSKLHPKVLDIVQLIMAHKKMADVMDLSPLTDLETSKIIFYLMKKKMITVK